MHSIRLAAFAAALVVSAGPAIAQNLPNGIEKRLEEGKTLPPGIEKKLLELPSTAPSTSPAVPEPGAASLFAAGLAVAAAQLRRRTR